MKDVSWHADFRQWLQQTRRRHGLSQSSLAILMRCTANYIWRLEKGKRCPSKEFLRLLRHEMPLTAAEAMQLEVFIQVAQHQGNGFERV